MSKPDILIVDGRAISWRRILEMRRQQVEAWKASEAKQSALFELKDDYRPVTERNAAGRYREPSLFGFAANGDV